MSEISESASEVAELARGYLRCSAELSSLPQDANAIWSPETNPDQRAYDVVDAAIRNGPAARAWHLVHSVLDQAADNRLAHQAAGPLEDLVRLRGAEVVEFIEDAAASDERFQWALAQIWIRASDQPPDVVRRIVAASGHAIEPI
jgi:hypothetical protein